MIECVHQNRPQAKQRSDFSILLFLTFSFLRLSETSFLFFPLFCTFIFVFPVRVIVEAMNTCREGKSRGRERTRRGR